ncbi:oligosaccharide flippase family protein [Candidatus Kaiserbacteria bacterium]|nr:oligosaccharide flippase family protein [Candidatus Kaiserbacteria bacterium]
MKYLAKGGFWISISYFIQVAIGVISTVALANLLPKESLGAYQYILSIAGILSVFTLSGLGTAITRAVAQGHDGALRSGVRTKLKWSVGIVITSGIVASYYLLNDDMTLGLSFLIVGACAPIIESSKLYLNFLYGKEAFRDSVLLGAWRKPLPLIALIATLLFTDSVLILIFVYFISNAISYVAVYFTIIKKYNPPLESNNEAISYAKHLTMFRILGTFSNNVDKVLLWHFLGPVSVANFTIAQMATKYSIGTFSSVNTLILPKLTRRDLPTLQKTLHYKVFLFTIMMACGAVVYVFLVPILFKYVFPGYLDSIVLTQLMAVSFLFVPRDIYSKALTAHKQIKSQYIMSIVIPIIKIILLFTLIVFYGIWGAIYAIIATDFISALATYYFFKRAKSV